MKEIKSEHWSWSKPNKTIWFDEISFEVSRHVELVFWLNIFYRENIEDVTSEIKWKYPLNRTILLLQVDIKFGKRVREDKYLLG